MLLPVVAREMIVQARSKGIYRLRTGSAVIALGLVVWLVVISSANVTAAGQGQWIFAVIATLSFAFCLAVGIRATSDCLSQEKREGTLGLLFLTDLRSHSIVLGKVAAGSIASIFGLLGAMPVLALAVLLGGITLLQVALTAVVLLNTMFLSLSAGAFVSAISRNERSAMLAAFVLIAALVFAPFLFSWVVDGSNAAFPDRHIWPSPLFVFQFVTRANFPGMSGHLVLPSLVVQHMAAWLLLGAASVLVRRSLHAEPRPHVERVRDAIKTHVYGSLRKRRQYRAKLLDRNAFLWLAARERIKPRYAWGVILLLAIGWTLMYLSFPRMVFDLPVAGMFLFTAHFVFKLWAASEVCSRLIEDRRSGALELLLSTPLSVREITSGQTRALRHIFFWPVAVLLAGEYLLLRGTVAIGWQGLTPSVIVGTFLAGASIFLLDLWAIKWLGMWQSLFATSIERVLLGTLARLLVLPWVLFAAVAVTWIMLDRLQQVTLTTGDLVLTWWIISALIGFFLGWSARVSFLRHFRTIAAGRFETSPRLAGAMDVWLNDLVHRFRYTARLVPLVPGPIRRHWVLSGVAVGILLLVGLSLGRQWLWHARVERELARVEAAGYPMSPETLNGYYPAVPAAENAVESFKRMGVPVNLPVVFPLDSTDPNVVQQAKRTRERQWPQIQALLSITNYSAAYLPPVIDPWQAGTVHLHRISQLGLQEIGLAMLDRDLPRAIAAAQSMLHLAALLREIPTSQAQVAVDWLLQGITDGLEVMLAQFALPPGTVEDLLARITTLENSEVVKKLLAVERARTIIISRNDFPGVTPVPVALINTLGNTAGTRDRELLQYLTLIREGLEAAERPVDERNQILNNHPSRLELVKRSPLFWQGQDPRFLLIIDLNVHARCRILRAGLALAAYREAHRRFPAGLEELVPEFLSELPRDPFTREVLGYTPGETALLWSAGTAGGQFPSPRGLKMSVRSRRLILDSEN